jgi:hypothetical protein
VSFDVPELSDEAFADYSRACATILARAHARSPEGAFIAGYIGHGSSFTDAVVTWSHGYADQSYADYGALRAAVASGRYESADLTSHLELRMHPPERRSERRASASASPARAC